jgi:U5 snRNP spliceosome subunit
VLVLTVLILYLAVISFGRRGGALLLGLTTGAALVGAMAVGAPGAMPASWQVALGAAVVPPLPPAPPPSIPTFRLPELPLIPTPTTTAPPTTTPPTTSPTPRPPRADGPAAAVTALTNVERRKGGCPEVRPTPGSPPPRRATPRTWR